MNLALGNLRGSSSRYLGPLCKISELFHNFFVKCLSAGLACEREQPHLLPDDPRRRPGDLYLPAWPGGLPVALDFAVTCPLHVWFLLFFLMLSFLVFIKGYNL